MYRMIYTSDAARDFGASDLQDVLQHANARNADEGITGLILYHEGKILQVLEGPEEAVVACYARIAVDPRHENLKIVTQAPVRASVFDSWKIGLLQPSALSADISMRVMTLVGVQHWLERALTSVGGREKNVIYALQSYIRGLGDIDARLDVDFLQNYEVDRRASA